MRHHNSRLTLNKTLTTKLRRTECNIIKNMLNVNTGCHNTSLLRAAKIKPIISRLEISQLNLYIRLTNNSYTAKILQEFESNSITSDFVKQIKTLTSSYSTGINMTDKCLAEIDNINILRKCG